MRVGPPSPTHEPCTTGCKNAYAVTCISCQLPPQFLALRHHRVLVGGAWPPASGAHASPCSTLRRVRPRRGRLRRRGGRARRGRRRRGRGGRRWAATPPRERAEILRRAFECMTARTRRDRRARSYGEMGKPLAEARGEAAYAAEFFRWFSRGGGAGGRRLRVGCPAARSGCSSSTSRSASRCSSRRGTSRRRWRRARSAPALAAGCTCVLKPAAETPLTALADRRALERGGRAGRASSTSSRRASSAPSSRAMLADPRVRKLSFTGSTEVGRELLKQARRRGRERLDGARRQRAVRRPRRRRPRRRGRGRDGREDAQRRRGLHRREPLLVHESVAEEFAPRLAERDGAVRVGPGLEPGAQLGPLINDGAREKVERARRRRRRSAARACCTGGERLERAGLLLPADRARPTSPGDARSLDEEIFGPVAADRHVRATRTRRSRVANDTEYGLVAYVYTRDLAPRAGGRRGARGRHGRPQPRASSPTPRRRSAASSRAASAARAATTASSSSSRPKYFAFD